ncbi:MAG: glycoside hydrolase family 97 protein [Daejeonella sp.]
MTYKFFIFFIFFFAAFHSRSQTIRLTSPDKSIEYTFRLTERSPEYTVVYKGIKLLNDSPLRLEFKEGGNFGRNLSLGKRTFRVVDEDYELIVGKNQKVRNYYSEVIIPMKENAGMFRAINLVVRAFNDGLAFRYEFSEQKNWTTYTLTNELSSFNLENDPTVTTLFHPNYTTSHEGKYSKLLFSEVKADTLMDMPSLFEFPSKVYLAITEAALRNYAGMYLVKENGMLTSRLSPLPGQTENKVKAILPHQTPWRVMMISDRMGALIESNILTSLNEPTKLTDVSWIKPGKTTFHWFNGDVVPDTSFMPGINFQTNKYYIDFCARNGIEYHSVIGYGGTAWYVNDGVSYQYGPHSDVTKPVASLSMQQICDYAKSKGVDIRVWVHWKPLYDKLDEAFAQFEKWEVKGMMVDFLDRDDQEMVNIQEEILQKAAKHKLHVQFHGAYKPTGMNRTYPNEFTREGTRNYENNKWGEGLSADHDINMPFTRLLAGATDYHLGGFRAVSSSEYKVQYTRPLMLSTRCHMLAMYVILESYLGMVCDYPSAYEGQPGFEFIREVPTVWDETRVPAAAAGEYVTIARRKGADWYVGTITNSTARSIAISLNFLPEGRYIAEIYSDAADATQNPDHLIKRIESLSRADVLQVKLAAGGGQVMKLVRQ